MAKPHWRQCVDYLERLNIISLNHPILTSENIVDFVNLLKDGTILCRLANKIDRNAINLNEVCMKPKQSTFLCLKNVQLFLDACVNHFNLDPSDLFKPDNLFECTNFVKVLSTISELSKSPKALQITGYKPLPDPSSNNSSQNDDLYKNLEKLSFRDESVEEEDPLSIYKTNIPNQKKEDTIYEDLCYVAVNVKASELPKCTLLPNNNRGHCIKELIDTERNYIDALNMISRHFMRPLKQLMRPEDHATVFFQIKLLLDLHNGFYTSLYQSVENSTLNDACISKAFFNWSSFFIIYGDYCSNLEKAQNLITDLVKKSTFFADAKQQCEKQANDGKFQLNDLIVLPMQRILKYHLLLNEIVKQTPETHSDYHSIMKAYEIMIDLGSYLNEIKRDSEMLDTINAIQNSITDLVMPEHTLLYDYGRLLRDDEIKVRSNDDNKLKTRYVFLFDKVIVMCKAIKGTQYSFKEAFSLADFTLDVQDNSSISSKFSSKETKSHIFHLVDCSKNQTYTFYAKTEELKNRWIQAIEKALDNICPQYCRSKLTNHTFIMKSFDRGSFCQQCDLWFKGLYYQGYKCVLCSLSVHKCCIPHTRPCGASLPKLPPKSSPQSNSFKKQLSVDRSFKNKFSESRRSLKLKQKQIEEYDWYAHTLERQNAERILQQLPSGAFLVRISSKQQGIYAISIKDNQTVKHMRILETEKNLFYLSQSKYFDDIVDLVDYYSKHSLSDSFFGLTLNLKFPYKRCLQMNITDENSKSFENDNVNRPILYCRALFKFQGDYPALSFQKGDIIEIIDKRGEQKGWYKGRKGNKVGYIPVVYVEEIDRNQVNQDILANLV